MSRQRTSSRPIRRAALTKRDRIGIVGAGLIALAIIIAAAALSSCTVARGNATTGEWAYQSVGGDFKGMLDSQGMVGEVDNSTSFVEGVKTAAKVVGYMELGKTVRGVATDARKSYEANRDLKLDRAKVDSREAIELRELDVKESALELEAAAPTPAE